MELRDIKTARQVLREAQSNLATALPHLEEPDLKWAKEAMFNAELVLELFEFYFE